MRPAHHCRAAPPPRMIRGMATAPVRAHARVARETLREERNAQAPWWYNPWVHLAIPSLVGATAIVTAVVLLRNPGPGDVLFVLVVLALTNANEWRIHKHILHRPSWPLGELFYRHTPEHHVIFVEEDMAIRSVREFRLVLIPSYGIIAIFVVTLPITLALAWFSRNLAALWVATTMAYVVSYEWLHLAYHLPPGGRIGGLRLIGILRRHHATHHRPELMQRWNFNVTVPFFDWVMGTIYREPGTSAR